MNREIKTKEVIEITMFFFIVVFAVYGLFLNQTYATDIIGIYGDNPKAASTIDWNSTFAQIVGERPTSFLYAFIINMFKLVGVDSFHHQGVIQLFSIILQAIGLSLLFFFFKPYVNEQLHFALGAGILVSAITPGRIEIFPFADIGFSFAFILCALALYCFENKRFIFTLVFVYLLVGSYQSFYALFVAFGLLFVFLHTNGTITKESAKMYLAIFLITFIAVAVVYFIPRFVSVFNGQQLSRETSLITNTVDYIDRIKMMYAFMVILLTDGYGFTIINFVKYWLLIITIIACLSLLVEKKIRQFTLYIVVYLIVLMIPFAFGIAASAGYYFSRAVTPFYASLGVIYIISFVCSCKGKEGKWIFPIIIDLFIVVYLVVMIYGVETGISDLLTAQKVEMQTCREVEKQIIEYENNNDIEVTTIKAAHFAEGRAAFDETYSRIGYRTVYSMHTILAYNWCEVAYLNYVSGEHYIDVTPTEEEMIEYFGDINKYESLHSFNPEEQLVFDGDTLYWMLY